MREFSEPHESSTEHQPSSRPLDSPQSPIFEEIVYITDRPPPPEVPVAKPITDRPPPREVQVLKSMREAGENSKDHGFNAEQIAEVLRGEANRLDEIAAKIEELAISEMIFLSDLQELEREAAQAGEIGRDLLDALPRREAGMEGLIDVPPKSIADFTRTLSGHLRKSEELEVQNKEQLVSLQEKINSLEAQVKVLESEQLRAKRPSVQAGEIVGFTAAATVPAALAAEVFKENVPKVMATTVLDVAGGGGLFLIAKICFKLSRGK